MIYKYFNIIDKILNNKYILLQKKLVNYLKLIYKTLKFKIKSLK